MNYADSVRFLYSLGHEVQAARLGLNRVTRLLEAMGNPHLGYRVVHVAGTNGKGSTCAMIESGLRAAGIRTGLFTSPHLIEPTERIQIAGLPVQPDQFVTAFERVHKTAERLMAENTLDQHPTYFETVCAMAFLLFRDQEVETAVLEVGLGGRLDATNVATAEVAVITPIDFDHEAHLGTSLDAITAEKAGVFKSGSTVVLAAQRQEAASILETSARKAGVRVVRTSDWKVEMLNVDRWGSRFAVGGPVNVEVQCSLPGVHQAENALTAVVALHSLGVPVESIRRGIGTVNWQGRLERVSESPDIVVDGAHNPAGARALAAYIERFFKGRRVWLIYGSMRDKAVSEMAGILFPLADRVILTMPNMPRAVRPEVIRELVDHPRVQVAERLPQALALLGECTPEDIVFISGSLFLVGEAKALLHNS